MYDKEHANQVGGGVFLIGLAMLFMTGWWFPGILFVIAASNIAKGLSAGQHWSHVSGGISLIVIGLFFMIGFRFELLLIAIGIAMLIGYNFNVNGFCAGDDAHNDKPKRKRKNNDYVVGIE